MFKYIVATLLSSMLLWSCPFDEANVEVTILAYKNIYNSAKSEDFGKASEEIVENKELYKYFEETTDKSIYQALLDASISKNTAEIKSILDDTVVLEINELLQQVEDDFDNYQKSRVLLVKAKKHLKFLTKDKQLMKYMKQLLKSIGNPGLMGVGKRTPDKEKFLKYKTVLLTSLNTTYGR